MLSRWMVVALALATAAVGDPVAAGETSAPDEPSSRLVPATPILRRCGTGSAEPASARLPTTHRSTSAQRFGAGGGTIEIPVFVHVVSGMGIWNVPDANIATQIAVLNDAYQGTGFQFVLAGTDRTFNYTWATASPDSPAETQMKTSLAVDPATTLNIYTNDSPQQYTGWSSFPWSYPEGDLLDGVVIFAECWAGGTAAPFNEGDIAVHEVGHWLGLYHTFQGGCSGNGDFVADTPPHLANYGCPTTMNTCSGGGSDPVRNYMNYVDDPCMDEFTPGQAARMDDQVAAYRPTIYASGSVAVDGDPVASLDLGNGPNPFGPGTRIFFGISRPGRVIVRVLDLSGRLVRAMGDLDLPPGRHSLWWDGLDRNGVAVGSGVYFYTLYVDGAPVGHARRMQLMR